MSKDKKFNMKKVKLSYQEMFNDLAECASADTGERVMKLRLIWRFELRENLEVINSNFDKSAYMMQYLKELAEEYLSSGGCDLVLQYYNYYFDEHDASVKARRYHVMQSLYKFYKKNNSTCLPVPYEDIHSDVGMKHSASAPEIGLLGQGKVFKQVLGAALSDIWSCRHRARCLSQDGMLKLH